MGDGGGRRGLGSRRGLPEEAEAGISDSEFRIPERNGNPCGVDFDPMVRGSVG